MPDNPLEVTETGDVTALGFSDRNNPSEDIYGPEAEAQAPAAEEVVEVEPEVQAEPEKAEGDESLLAQVPEDKAETPSEESEISRLRAKNLGLEAALLERQKVAEEQIRAAATPETPPDKPESFLDSPYVQQSLKAVQEENPEQYQSMLVEIAKADLARDIDAREKALIDRIEQSERVATEATQRAAVKQGIETAFNKVRAEGGLSAELVGEFQERGMDSHIGREMQTRPELFYSEQGAEDAVRILESKLRASIESAKHQEPSRAVQGTVTSAGTGAASTRGVTMDEKPIPKSTEEEYADRMFNTSRGNKIEFLG